MAIDYGDVRIGIAQSDLMQVIASPLDVIQNTGLENSAKKIAELAKANEVETIVLGLPLNMDGSEGTRAEITRQFALEISKHLPVKIVSQDERLSSVEAEEMLLEANVRRDKRKKIIDKVAACIILETYLNRKEK
jgi:putative Holliday junction resolvase